MRWLFVDASFLIAWIDPKDRLHSLVLDLVDDLFRQPIQLVTADAIVYEVLAFFSRRGEVLRAAAVETAREILRERTLECVPVDRELLLRGIARYEQRPDKTYSLVDCISMEICDDRGITEVLTYDEDFVREGFAALLR